MASKLRSFTIPVTSAILCAAFVGCNSQNMGPPAERVKRDPRKMVPGELQQFVSTNAAVAMADTGASLTKLPDAPLPPEPLKYQPEFPKVPVTPAIGRITHVSAPIPAPVETNRRNSAPIIRIEKIISDKFCENSTEAKNDALKVASRRISQQLQELKPPISVRIRPSDIVHKYMTPNSGQDVPLTEAEAQALSGTKVEGNRYRYQLDVEISEAQLQSMRGEERISDLAPFIFGGLAISGLASLFLRLTGVAAAAVRWPHS